MKIYVCFSAIKNFRHMPRPGGHPCANAHVALKKAGYKPEVEAVGGLGRPPFDHTKGRRKVKELTGDSWVPVLVTDDGQVIKGSREIMTWAAENPAPAA